MSVRPYSFESIAHDGVSPSHTKRPIPDNCEARVELKRFAKAIPHSNAVPTMAVKKKTRKPPNYLRHSDRCCIIKRVASGEQQAALAREFGVTRAAVCQIYKNRDEILARGDDMEPQVAFIPDPRVLHTKTSLSGDGLALSKASEGMASSQLQNLEFRSKRVMLLLAVLRDGRTSTIAFRRAAARLTFILVEEALATYDYDEIIANTERGFTSVAYCAVTLGSASVSFSTAFGQIDPNLSTGQIHVKADHQNGLMNWQLQYLDVPDNISDFEVLLFSTSAYGGAECKAIEALQKVGVLENRISLVMVVCSSHGYEEISDRYPRVTIISAAIDDKRTLHQALCPPNVVPTCNDLHRSR